MNYITQIKQCSTWDCRRT